MADAQPNLISQFWNDPAGSFQRLQEYLGFWGALLVIPAFGVVLLWWHWEHLAKKPGIDRLATRIGARRSRRAITPVRDGRFTIAIAHLQGDTGFHHESLLRDELAPGFDGAECKPIDHTIAVPEAETDQTGIEKATGAARKLLRQAGADVLIWGRALSRGDHTALRLFWTSARSIDGAKPSERYQLPSDSIALPPLFWDDLRQVLGLLVQSRLAALADELQGRAAAARLKPLIEQVRNLLQTRQGSWPAGTEAGVRFAFAWALKTYGEQAGDNAALAESAAAYRQVLEAGTRDRAPLDWAGSQLNLGLVLEVLANRRRDPAGMEAALVAMRGAADVFREGGVSYWLPRAEENIRRMEAALAALRGGAAAPRQPPPQ